MSDPGILDDAVTTAATGTGFGAGFFAIRWLVQWLTARADKRQAELDAEHATLDMSWKEYRLSLERRLRAMERANEALRLSFQHVSGALIRLDPHNEALVIADKLMAEAFPTDFQFTTTLAGAALDEDDRRRAAQ